MESRVRAHCSVLLTLLLAACVTRASGPETLAEAAASAPEGGRRASIYMVRDAAQALERGEIRSARGLVSRALRVDGRNPYAYFVLGKVAAAEGDRANALRQLEQALLLFKAVEPGNTRWYARVLRVKAELLDEMGRGVEAEALRQEAEQLDASEGSWAHAFP